MNQTPEASMLSVPLPEKEIHEILHCHPDVSLAIVNGPTNIVTGPDDAIKIFADEMKKMRLMCAEVNMGHGVHSSMMEPIRQDFQDIISQFSLKQPSIPYISNLDGFWIKHEDAVSPAYWGKHLCSRVQFSKGIDELLKLKDTVFVEIGPGRLLSNILRQQIRDKNNNGYSCDAKVVNIIKHQQENMGDDLYLLNRLGELWLYGTKIDWSVYSREQNVKRLHLPGYAFEEKRFWLKEDIRFAGGDMKLTSIEDEIKEHSMHTGSQEDEVFDSPEDFDMEEEYVAPRDDLEIALADLWKEYLGFERIGIHANFFEINGDSLTATQMITRLQQIYPVEVSLQLFFEEPTIARLAAMVKELLKEKVKNLSPEELEKLV
jgi:acyl transferase domain-containing protein